MLTLFYPFAGMVSAIRNDFVSFERDRQPGMQSLPVMFGFNDAKWIWVGMIDGIPALGRRHHLCGRRGIICRRHFGFGFAGLVAVLVAVQGSCIFGMPRPLSVTVYKRLVFSQLQCSYTIPVVESVYLCKKASTKSLDKALFPHSPFMK